MQYVGIKKAVGEYQQSIKMGRYAKIYANLEDGHVWENEYINICSWSKYESPAIWDVTPFILGNVTQKSLKKTLVQLPTPEKPYYFTCDYGQVAVYATKEDAEKDAAKFNFQPSVFSILE